MNLGVWVPLHYGQTFFRPKLTAFELYNGE